MGPAGRKGAINSRERERGSREMERRGISKQVTKRERWIGSKQDRTPPFLSFHSKHQAPLPNNMGCLGHEHVGIEPLPVLSSKKAFAHWCVLAVRVHSLSLYLPEDYPKGSGNSCSWQWHLLLPSTVSAENTESMFDPMVQRQKMNASSTPWVLKLP